MGIKSCLNNTLLLSIQFDLNQCFETVTRFDLMNYIQMGSGLWNCCYCTVREID